MLNNKTKNRTITNKVKYCKNFVTKGFGLMFKGKNFNPYIFIFNKEKIIPLHMWFVFFPIDVLFLDKDKKVVEIVEGLKSFGFYKPKKKAKYIIELRVGSVKDNFDIGDVVEF
tara:strand:- start:1435 stop:1773 length:339 start_codon:yes stop_codon:yes gene_type:complete